MTEQIKIKTPKNEIGKKQLEEFITYMKEKCGITESLEIQDSIEGAIQMHKVVFPKNMRDTCKKAWNHFMQEASKEIQKKYKIEANLVKKNKYGILYWDIPSNTINMYFVYKIHMKIISEFLHSEDTEKIWKLCNPEQQGCY